MEREEEWSGGRLRESERAHLHEGVVSSASEKSIDHRPRPASLSVFLTGNTVMRP